MANETLTVEVKLDPTSLCALSRDIEDLETKLARLGGEKARLDALRLDCLRLVDDGPRRREQAKELFDFVTDAPTERQRWIVKRATANEDAAYLQIGLRFATWGHSMFATVFGSVRDASEAIENAGQIIQGGVAGAVPLNITHEAV